MEEGNAVSEVVAEATDNGVSLMEKPVDSIPTKEKKEDNGVGEIKEDKACDDKMDLDSKENEEKEVDQGDEDKGVAGKADKHPLTEKERESQEVAPQEGVEHDDGSTKAVQREKEPKEAEAENVLVKDDECKETAEQNHESNEGAVPEKQVKDADEEKPNEVAAGAETENTDVDSKDDKNLGSERNVNGNEENREDEMKPKEGKQIEEAVTEDKDNVELKQTAEASEPKAMEEDERNPEKKNVTSENDIETEKVEEKLDGSSIEKEKSDEDKGSKKRSRRKNAVDKKKGENKDEKDPETPIISSPLRPVRERKSVERLVAVIEKDVIREIFVEKGPGVALKDIPNVAYKLSRKRNDDTFKQLHPILFGRRGKAAQMKTHVSKFSGFVWHDNEEKSKMKVKEKFDKLVKEKLIEFCDVLDIPITNKVTTKKEDIVTKLMDFLAAPHATTEVVLSETDQSGKAPKRNRSACQSSPTLESASSKGSKKLRRKTSDNPQEEDQNSESDVDCESDKEQDNGVKKDNENGKQDQAEDESSEKSASMEKQRKSEEATDEETKNQSAKKSSTKKRTKPATKVQSSAKKRTKPNAPAKADSRYSEEAAGEDANNLSPKKSSAKAAGVTRKRTEKSNSHNKVGSSSKSVADTEKGPSNPKVASGKKKQIKEKVAKEKASVPSKASGKTDSNSKAKAKPKEEKMKPSDKVLSNQICQILKEVDFNTATFTDILKLLGEHFKTDLTPRKSSIKLMIQEELTKLADDADDEEEEAAAPEPPKVDV